MRDIGQGAILETSNHILKICRQFRQSGKHLTLSVLVVPLVSYLKTKTGTVSKYTLSLQLKGWERRSLGLESEKKHSFPARADQNGRFLTKKLGTIV